MTTSILGSAYALAGQMLDPEAELHAAESLASRVGAVGTETAQESPTSPVPADGAYSYGSGGASEAQGYISDGDLLLWLQSKSQEMYGQVRYAMDVSTARSKLIQDLTHVKGMADAGASREQIDEELYALRDAYVGTEFEDELTALCTSNGLSRPAAIQSFAAETAFASGDEGSQDVADFAVGTAQDITHDDAKELEALAGDIQAEIDKLGRDDQLALIQIQNLMSNIRETSQLTSNMLASRDQASNTIVGNIRG